jgi:hypothetical protein
VFASGVKLHRLGPGYPALPPAVRHGVVMIVPTPYKDEQVAQIMAEGWVHVPKRTALAQRKPTHVALYEGANNMHRGQIAQLLPIVQWRLVSGEAVRQKATFGRGQVGRKDYYYLVELDRAAAEVIHPPIPADGRGYRQPEFVPLEVIDAADSALMLRDGPALTEVLRVLSHLRRHLRQLPSVANHLQEPLQVQGRRLGSLTFDGEIVRWEVGVMQGVCSTEDAVDRTVSALFDPIAQAIQVVQSRVCASPSN